MEYSHKDAPSGDMKIADFVIWYIRNKPLRTMSLADGRYIALANSSKCTACVMCMYTLISQYMYVYVANQGEIFFTTCFNGDATSSNTRSTFPKTAAKIFKIEYV